MKRKGSTAELEARRLRMLTDRLPLDLAELVLRFLPPLPKFGPRSSADRARYRAESDLVGSRVGLSLAKRTLN